MIHRSIGTVVLSHPDIFVVGDTAAVTDQPGIPGTAVLVKLCRLAHRRGRPSPPPFRYRHLGDLATIGRHAAVVKLGRPELTSFLGCLSGAWCRGTAGVGYAFLSFYKITRDGIPEGRKAHQPRKN